MTTPATRAHWLRAALVGVCAAVSTVGAHAASAGVLPHGAALIAALLVCATSGAAATGIRLQNRHAHLLGLIAALGAAQLLGHLTLTMAGGHHAAAGLGMIAAHAGAAVVLGVAIGAVEHLYLVCSSVLRWLRLFAAFTPRPALPRARRRANNVVAQSLLWRTGLGMRAPPMGACATA